MSHQESNNQETFETPVQKLWPGKSRFRALFAVAAVGLSICSAGLVQLIPSTPAFASTGSDWPSYLDGPSHTSYNADATSITVPAVQGGNLQPVWRWIPPASNNSGSPTLWASPTVVDGVVYIGAEDGMFYALQESTQTVLWSQFVGIDPPTTCAGATLGVTGTAAVVTDPGTGMLTVYVNGADGNLYAFDAATGDVIWKSVVDTPSSTQNDYYAWGSPLVANDTVYVGIASDCDKPLVQAGLVAFNQDTGAQVGLWNSEPQGDIGGSIWSSPGEAPDGSIFVTTGNGSNGADPLYAESIVHLSASTLQFLDGWQVPKAQVVGDGDFGASPTMFSANLGGVTTPMVGACNKNGYYYAFRQDDLSAGPVWQYQMHIPTTAGEAGVECDAAAIWNGSTLIEAGGTPTTINGVTYNGSVRALNPSTGVPLWQTGLPGAPIGSATEDGSGVVAVPIWSADSTTDMAVYLLDASDGAIIGSIATPNSAEFAQPVFAGNDLLVAGTAAIGLTAYEITTAGPAITGVSPNKVASGTTSKVTLTGSGFSGTPTVFVSGNAVHVNSVVLNSATTLTVSLTASSSGIAGDWDIAVLQPGSPNDTASTCTKCLTVGAPASPSVSSVTPNTLSQGQSKQSVVVSGSNFEFGASVTSAPGSMLVFKAITWISSSQIDATLSAGTTTPVGSYTVWVNNPHTASGLCNGCVKVLAPTPTVTSVTPNTAYPGLANQPVVVKGSNFASGANVTAVNGSGVNFKSVTWVSSSQIDATMTVTPSAALGGHDVFVVNPAGATGRCSGCLTVVADPIPTFTSVSPSAVGEQNGFTLTLVGSGFTSNSAVAFSSPDVTVNGVQGVGATGLKVSVTVSIGATLGPGSVTVTTPGGSSTCTGCLTIDTHPIAQKVSPSLAPGATTTVTVTGYNFVSGLTVSTNIAGATVGPPSDVTSNSFRVAITVPGGTAAGTTYTLTVVNPDGGKGVCSHLAVS